MPSDFEQGVNWGKFLVTMHEDEVKFENARMAVLQAVTDYIDSSTTRTDTASLRQTMMDAWYAYLCHGSLPQGQTCPVCGTYRAEDD